MQTLIRVATQDDVDTLFAIRINHLSREQMADVGITRQGLGDSIRKGPCVWIAEVDGQPAAFSMAGRVEGDDVRYQKRRAP